MTDLPNFQPGKDVDLMAVPRETSPLEALNGGWPFGPGPARWRWNVQERPATESQPEGLHLICSWCDQSVTRLGRWSVSLESLKPQIAAHVMQVHSDQVTG